ncbi:MULTISPECIES: AzlD domain-containing protein [unclassified Staphylococcus]|uniref:AzlD domain-containing protein n=1 Tax=unclassified Staphylococcus TaxID=91994 RepID=UPI0021D2937B|nr:MULTISPECIES: AzlD domain-containing protein [unclassified Staphylococcus]UXR69614.1 AzlD domain-containing protein [Staphylococcus sp. IVB6246]UXR71657.1 AzlD domain-containing protein [Staphylococcus sp. IVB6240]UXR76253.1 AzlD domain-containing protein [Staphylococcus sp. IVB6233]UXR80451.1 AzlD domain-containing protein [Staphylococcus sp. IVB6218]
MTTFYFLSAVVLSGLVTLLVRILPLIMISRLELSEKFIKWLSFIPITLFTALVVDGLIQQQDGQFGYTINWTFLIALAPTILVALRTRSLTMTVIIGMITVAILRVMIGA